MTSVDFFSHQLQQSLSRARRHPERLSALLVVKLYSKAKANESLKELSSYSRCEDTLALLPDHQIGIILEDLKDSSDPLRVAERYCVQCPKAIAGLAIVILGARFKSANQALTEAYKALATHGKPGCAVFSDPKTGEEANFRLRLEEDLEQALKEEKLDAFYQPLFNLQEGRLTGFEALVRWNHPKHGLLLPAAFLHLAEQKGLLLKLDEFVLKHALRHINLWNEKSDRPIYVSANLCSDHFLKESNLNSLLKTLNTQPKALDLLRIDVCEDVLVNQDGIDSLKTLDMLKIGFNLDDFGVDSKSFHCLGHFPFNALKIDRNLVDQMENEVNAELIVTVLRIARKMGMKTIAEGVVTHAQLEELRNLGCTEAQGFLFSEAVSAAEAEQMISTVYRW